MAEAPDKFINDGGLAKRHRPMFFVISNGLYLLLVSLFPLVLPYVLHDDSAFSRLMVLVNLIILLQEALNFGLAKGLSQLAIQTPEAEISQVLAQPLKGGMAILVGQGIFASLLLGGAWFVRPDWFDGNGWIFICLWLSVLCGLMRYVTQGLLYGTRLFGWFVGFDLSWAALRLIIVPVGWWLGGITGALAAMTFLIGLTCFPALLLLKRRGLQISGTLRAGFNALSYYLRFGFWLQLTTMAGSLLRPAIVLLFAVVLGKTHAAPGFAHLALSMFLLVTVMMDALFLGLYPEKAEAGRDGGGEKLLVNAAGEARALGFLLAPAAWLGTALAPLAARLLPIKFHDVGNWLAIIILALPARGMAQPFIIAMQAGHRPRRAAIWQWMRFGVVVVGVAIGLTVCKKHPLAPMWGVTAGEWLTTCFLILTIQYYNTPLNVIRSVLPILFLIVIGSTITLLGGLWIGQLRAVLIVSVIWLITLPALRVVAWSEARSLLHPHISRLNGID